MNTFLIHPNHRVTAKCLDIERLNRQLCECIGVAKALFLYEKTREMFNRQIPFGVIFPPVIKLWLLDEDTILLPELFSYYVILAEEWRKIKGTDHKTTETFDWNPYIRTGMRGERVRGGERPWDLEWPEEVHQSHRARLFQKDTSYYGKVFREEGLQIVESKDVIYKWKNPFILKREIE